MGVLQNSVYDLNKTWPRYSQSHGNCHQLSSMDGEMNVRPQPYGAEKLLSINGCWGGGTHFSSQYSHRQVIHNPINNPTPLYMRERLVSFKRLQNKKQNKQKRTLDQKKVYIGKKKGSRREQSGMNMINTHTHTHIHTHKIVREYIAL